MPTPITNTSVTFTYKIPDEMYGQTSLQNKTATGIYNGPDQVWVFVRNDSGKLADYPILTTREDGGDVPTPADMTKVHVVADINPLIISILSPYRCVTQNQNTISETLPNGNIKEYNEFQEVQEAYNRDDLVYDLENNKWKDLEFIKPQVTWTDIINSRNEALKASDGRISPDMPESLKSKWVEYRQKLRDFPATFGYGTPNEIDAWKVSLPLYPVE